MKTETDFINDIRTIVSNHIQNFDLVKQSRDPSTVSSMDVTLAIIVQNNSITEALITDLINYKINSNKNVVDFKTFIDLGNLDTEVILISSEIYYT